MYPTSTRKEKIKLLIIILLPILVTQVAMSLMNFFDTVMSGQTGAVDLAGLLYMIPLSVGMALTITVGFEIGAGRLRDAKIYASMGAHQPPMESVDVPALRTSKLWGEIF